MNLKNVPSNVLAQLIAEGCIEMNLRWQEQRDKSLEAALAIWPPLRQALSEKGKKLGLNGFAKPRLLDWADQPVVCLEGSYENPSTKRRALALAQIYGAGGWATIGELWLWVGGGGPIITRALQKFGFLEGEPVYGYKKL